MLALFLPSSAARRRRFAAAAALGLVAALAGLGQPAAAAEKDARTPVPSKSAPKTASPTADKKKADKKKAVRGKAADKGKAAATAKAPADRKAAPTPTPTPTPPPAAKAKAKAQASAASTAAPVAPKVTTAGKRSVTENGTLAITSVESLNEDIDVKVTWDEYPNAGTADFYNFEVTATPGNWKCSTAYEAASATTCTIADMPAGEYSFVVKAIFEFSTSTSPAYPATIPGGGTDVPSVTASFRESTMPDHDWTAIKFLIKRTDTTSAAENLGFTATLPAGLVVADTGVSPTCIGGVAVEEGGSTITLSGATINAGVEECSFGVSVTSTRSGSYPFTNGGVSGLAGGLNNMVTTQTLTVTGADPTISAAFNPATVAAKAIALLRVNLKRGDENPTSQQAGIGYQLALPTGLTVAAGQTSNTCQGQLTAAVNGGTVSLSGVTITANGGCYVQIPVSAAKGGSYGIDNSDFSNLMHVDPDVMTGCKGSLPGISGEGCGPTLEVSKLPQTITFNPKPSVPLASGTYALTATATAEGPVTYSVSPESVCTVSGSTLTLVGIGTCLVTAMQGGDQTYKAADPVERLVSVVPPPPAAPTLTGGVSSVTATWAAPQNTTGITGYRVSASPGEATCTTTTATTCVLGGTAGTAYTVTVAALVGSGASAESPASNPATPTTPQPPATVPDTNLTLTTDQGIITSADPGEEIVFIGTGFAPHSTVVISIYSAPTVLGTTVTDALGNFSKPITIPRSLAAGAHTALAQGVDPDGLPRSMKLAIQVARASGGSGGGGLPVTGVPIALIVLMGLALVGAGTGLTKLSRRT